MSQRLVYSYIVSGLVLSNILGAKWTHNFDKVWFIEILLTGDMSGRIDQGRLTRVTNIILFSFPDLKYILHMNNYTTVLDGICCSFYSWEMEISSYNSCWNKLSAILLII